MKKKLLGLAALLLVAPAIPRLVSACGDWTTPSVAGHESQILALGPPQFETEVGRLLKYNPQYSENPTGWRNTITMDVADLQTALPGRPANDSLIPDYQAMRAAMKTATDGSEDSISFSQRIASSYASFNLTPYEPLMQRLPPEFALYVRGASLYRNGDFPAAITQWQKVLALPAAERKYRSTWAAYMIGKTLLHTDPSAAIPFFEQTRQLARDGLSDPVGFAGDSLGWQAMAELKSDKPAAALRHYIESARLSTQTSDVFQSIGLACRATLAAPQIDPSALADPLERKVLIIWANSDSSGIYNKGTVSDPHAAQRLREVLITSKTIMESDETDNLAWGAYSSGNLDAARQWLELSPTHTPMGRWIHSKLLLHDGKIDEALAELKAVVHEMPTYNSDSVHLDDSIVYRSPQLDRGLLLLGRKDFVAAFDALVRSPMHNDAAYLAERVLEMDELSAYLRQHKDDPALGGALEQLNYILARRLARAHLWKQARTHYPAGLVPQFDDYVAFMKAAQDEKRGKHERAENLFKAAWIMRYRGMELFGTEVNPDWSIHDGDFEETPIVQRRRQPLEVRTNPALDRLLKPTQEELDRVDEHTLLFENRWHYRFRASELMWQVAQLTPDNDPLTAAALYWGGYWHRGRIEDDAYADRFYQEAVRRCFNLPIGKEMEKTHWFPLDMHPPTPQELRALR